MAAMDVPNSCAARRAMRSNCGSGGVSRMPQRARAASRRLSDKAVGLVEGVAAKTAVGPGPAKGAGGQSNGIITQTNRDTETVAKPADGFGRVKRDRKSTRLNSSHLGISYAVFCLK